MALKSLIMQLCNWMGCVVLVESGDCPSNLALIRALADLVDELPFSLE